MFSQDPKARVTQRKLNHNKEQEPCRWCSWRHRRQRNTVFSFLSAIHSHRQDLTGSQQPNELENGAFGCPLSELERRGLVQAVSASLAFGGQILWKRPVFKQCITACVKTPQYRKCPEATVGFVHLRSTPQRNWGKMPALDLYFSFPSLFLHFPPPTFPFSSSPQTGLKGEVSNRIAF